MVGRMGRAYLAGLDEGGVLGVMKHFPGLGPTRVDSHAALPRAEGDAATFRRSHLRPFREAAATAPAVMVGHAHYPFLDPVARPASASPAVIQGLLRGELGYAGTAIADDLEMGAVEQGAGWVDAAAAAIAAGCDMVLVCHSIDRMRQLRDRLLADASSGRLPPARLEGAAARVRRLQELATPQDGGDFAGCCDTLRRRFAAGPR